MRSLVGFTRTGRIQKGPGSDLIEMTAPDGSRHTAIEFHPEYRSHNAINAALGVVLSFLESPLVSGLTDLGAYELGQSVFVYPTGQTWSVAEVVRTLSDLGEVGGVRAGVELLAQAGQILVEAAETGESAGVYSHGGLTPWRVMLDADGQVQIIGHALPQVEILTFHEQPDRIPREDAFRYCPPERMESRRENFSSDLFGLALIAFEVMCGKPVYDGLVNDIRAKAARGETSRRIHQFREFLPESVRSLLTTTMRPDFRDRFGAGADFFDAVNAALSDPAVEGVGLRDMMQRVIRQQPRARQELDPGKTSMLSKDQLKKMMEEEEAPARPQRAAFAPARPAQPVASPPTRAEPPRPAERPRVEPAPEPVRSVSMDALGASSSRVGLPPARRPPPRTEPTPEALPPAAAAVAPVAPPVAPPAAPAAEPPRFGPPLRQGARPNPRASHAGEPVAAPPPPAAPVAAPPPAPPEPASAEPPRPAVGVARLPPSRRPPPREDAAEALPDAGRAVPPAPDVGSSGDRARDLLARVRASGNDVTHRPTPSASAVIDRILTSSGSGNSLRDRVARAVHVDQAEQAEAARVEPAPARVEPPRQEPGLPPPAARPEPPAPPRHPRPEPEPAAPAPVAAPVAPAPPVTPPPVAPPPVPVAAPPVAAPPVAPPVTTAPPVAATPAVPAAAPPSPVTTAVGTTKRYRIPDALKSNLRGDPLPYKLSRGNGSPVQRRRVPAASTLADIVGLLVGQVVPMRVTPDGRVAGWWRLGPASGPIAPDTRLDTLDPEVPLVFHYVEARTLLLDVEIVGDVPVRLRLPVSTAVPAQSLIDALTTMFDLPAGEWVLAVDGAPLEPFHVLEDRGVGAASQLQLRRA